MAHRATKSLATPWLLTLAMTVCLVVLSAVAYMHHLGWMADEVVGQMASLSEEEALAKLRRTAELGDRGLPILVAALGSRSEHLIEAARQVLLEEIDRWELRSADAAGAKFTSLADQLAQRVERFDDRGRRAAADVAARILLWPAYGVAVDRDQLVSSCAIVLRARRPDRLPQPRITVTQPAGDVALAEEQEVSPPGPSAPPLEAELSLDQLEALPGGGLPIDPLHLTESSDANTSSRISSANTDLAADGGQPTSAGRPDLAAGMEHQAQLLENPLGTTQSDARRPFGSHFAAQAGPVDHAGQQERRPWERPVTEKPGPVIRNRGDLLRLLRDPDPTTVAWAERQLVAGGFSSSLLNLARRLADPSAETRLYWARRLPTIQGIDAQAWLLWVAEDDNADVRLAAITLLATSGDPEMLKRVSHLARRDRDERIRRQAERILAEQRRF